MEPGIRGILFSLGFSLGFSFLYFSKAAMLHGAQYQTHTI